MLVMRILFILTPDCRLLTVDSRLPTTDCRLLNSCLHDFNHGKNVPDRS
jgi:hypothetical protein